MLPASGRQPAHDGPRDLLWWSRGPVASGWSRVLLGFTGRGGDPTDDRRFGTDNLGLHVGDDEAAVLATRGRLADRVGVAPERLFLADQVHGTDVAVADAPWHSGGPSADVVVTRTPGTAVAVMVADCVPVLLADPSAGVVAVAHAGRQGMAAGVVPSALAAMRDLGARDVRAVVGPSVCARCYEVPAELRDRVAAVVPVAASVSGTGTPSIDVAAGVLHQLHSEGVPVELVRGCTVERPDLFSHRRDGHSGGTGRFAGVVVLDGER